MESLQARLEAQLQKLAFPKHRIIMVHARLRGLQQCTRLSYPALSQQIKAALLSFQPYSILIPAYTITSFRMGRIFHRLYSHAETGRFSEELRLSGMPRTSDPVYSLLDSHNYLAQQSCLNSPCCFGKNSVFAHLYCNNAVILNIDMPGFWSTLIHQLEWQQQVPYRQLKMLSGQIYHNATNHQLINYPAYLRKLNQHGVMQPFYDQKKRLDFLQSKGILREDSQQNISLRWTYAQNLMQVLEPELDNNPYFLISQQQSPDFPWLT
ncbi:AAC(3) family N-acetyltransferase [Candidatus Venteria ishoeyi]|uniref:AAC(3) family N-acetyltransferase n=1 Tax=Candidatus Venteria ishoeyi TaxID=1899563 RepID=UPI0025A4F344|nr:AAC(3) family N-acetyltransferase [Candidatus Venteria ishoeyi]MDM8547480.1 AAC(3) family N-acetyltransferase [Candidatus Venteria ishoeyi]